MSAWRDNRREPGGRVSIQAAEFEALRLLFDRVTVWWLLRHSTSIASDQWAHCIDDIHDALDRLEELYGGAR